MNKMEEFDIVLLGSWIVITNYRVRIINCFKFINFDF